ncbi:hypothetical protein [Priestia megaterium]|uniref:hypothetical protein n=1 Tax=Priestia megaterium TaxID=1404 RepID=UPI002E24DCBD|nr:hypothetical protein [Priestia megaterium]
MRIHKEEQETVITFDAKKGQWSFYTCVPSHIRLFLTNSMVDTEKIEILTTHEGKATSIKFKLEKSLVSPKDFVKKQRVLSDKQRQALQQGRKKRIDAI